ncbi:MAG: 50S ribosomal protein L19 [Planctomycetota bacterium]|jgi:large subunit ribosomal protein L19
MNPLMKEVDALHEKKEVDNFEVGDTVDVHVRIIEGEKERIQIFSGTVISIRGESMNKYFTVRHLFAGEGVERMFPVHSPRIEKIVVKRRGKAQRAKLYYLRDRIGKSAVLKEDNRKRRPPVASAQKKKKSKKKKKEAAE